MEKTVTSPVADIVSIMKLVKASQEIARMVASRSLRAPDAILVLYNAQKI